MAQLAKFMKPLKEEVDNDPLGRGYSAMTDQEVADSLTIGDRPQYRRVPMSEVHEWASAKRIHKKFEDASLVDSPLYKELILLVEGKQESVNFQSEDTGVSGLITDMVNQGIIDQTEAGELQSLGTYYISRAKEIGFNKPISAVTIETVRSF